MLLPLNSLSSLSAHFLKTVSSHDLYQKVNSSCSQPQAFTCTSLQVCNILPQLLHNSSGLNPHHSELICFFLWEAFFNPQCCARCPCSMFPHCPVLLTLHSPQLRQQESCLPYSPQYSQHLVHNQQSVNNVFMSKWRQKTVSVTQGSKYQDLELKRWGRVGGSEI